LEYWKEWRTEHQKVKAAYPSRQHTIAKNIIAEPNDLISIAESESK
jgi:hypothetical protein